MKVEEETTHRFPPLKGKKCLTAWNSFSQLISEKYLFIFLINQREYSYILRRLRCRP
jgi:hypothetical protein